MERYESSARRPCVRLAEDRTWDKDGKGEGATERQSDV
jgi:hypothetical protein